MEKIHTQNKTKISKTNQATLHMLLHSGKVLFLNSL